MTNSGKGMTETDVFDRIYMSSPSTPPATGSVLGLYPSCVGQQHSVEYTTVQCLGAQLVSIIPHEVTPQKTVILNNLSEVSGPARQYCSVQRPATSVCNLGTKMADTEACDSVSARNKNCGSAVHGGVRPTF
jgi:purine nucleoside permease